MRKNKKHAYHQIDLIDFDGKITETPGNVQKGSRCLCPSPRYQSLKKIRVNFKQVFLLFLG